MSRTDPDVVSPNGDGQAVVEAVPVDRPPPAPEVPENNDSKLQLVGGLVAQVLLALLVVAAGVGLTYFIVSQKTAPAMVGKAAAAPVVEAQRVTPHEADAVVRGFGTVRAAREVSVVPQVGGRVVATHPGLVAGGRIPAGAILLEIDPTDYEIAVEVAEADVERAEAALKRIDARRGAAQAEVARAQTSLETMRAEAEVAREEYERVNPNQPVPPLVGREPQIRQTEAAVAAAEAQLADVDTEELELAAGLRQANTRLRQATVNLSRTKVQLPEMAQGEGAFRVASESVDVGQYVVPGAAVASVYDADALEVPVPLDDRQLPWIDLANDGGEGSPATLRVESAGNVTWPGRVDRTEGQINPRTRLTEVVILAESATSADGSQRLVPGRFVQVEIAGRPLQDTIALPRRAIHLGPDGQSVVWIAEQNGTDGAAMLRLRPVEIARRSGTDVFIRGVEPGALVVLTRLDVATDGMPIQVGDIVESE